MTTPTFWMSMVYACDNPDCDYETTFLLEEGCEGAVSTHGHPVPVPMTAGPCPDCNPDGRTKIYAETQFGRMKVGFLTHARWNEDRLLDPRPTGIPEQAHFRYPTRAERRRHPDRACGRPVYAGRP